ncbi:hypothetical protein DPMN_078553 [Dreissena polymorpha]|uniref:Uncharacterized protein n=1 Tax=Dreissena polymorpha TaxID=45954 RepID=A0A9D4BHL4_DREPO|nr:hypothetical protein DPMN_078553 [Dreissena polymorpha]
MGVAYYEQQASNNGKPTVRKTNVGSPDGTFNADSRRMRLMRFKSDSPTSLEPPHSTRKNAPPTGGHVFQATGTTFELVHNIIGTNLLTKFHDDRTINMASRVLTRPRPLGGHVFPPTGTIFELIQDVIETNHQTKFHDDRTINVASRVLTRKNAPPLTNLLTKFHEDRKINVASRVLTRKNAPPPGSHFHEDRTINVASRVKNAPPLGSHVFKQTLEINVASRVFTRINAQPLGSHVFQANLNIFELIQDIIEANLPIEFHEDLKKIVASRVLARKTAPPPGGHFHDDWANIVTSRVFTRNTDPPPGGHLHEDWASNVTSTVFTIFELSRGINGTISEINVASKVITRQNVDDGRHTTDDARRTKSNHKSSQYAHCAQIGQNGPCSCF